MINYLTVLAHTSWHIKLTTGITHTHTRLFLEVPLEHHQSAWLGPTLPLSVYFIQLLSFLLLLARCSWRVDEVPPCVARVLGHCGCVWLCNPMDGSPPGSSVHGILQARMLEWVAMSSSRRSSPPRIKPTSPKPPALVGEFFTTSPTCPRVLNSLHCDYGCSSWVWVDLIRGPKKEGRNFLQNWVTFWGELPASNIPPTSSLTVTLSHNLPETSSILYSFRRDRAFGRRVIDDSENPSNVYTFELSVVQL